MLQIFVSISILKLTKMSTPIELDAKAKFRNLTLLLCFITSLRQGQPCLPDHRAPKLWELVRKHGGVIDAVTTILVQNHEIIAATTVHNTSSGVAVDNPRPPVCAPQSPNLPQFAPHDSGIDLDVPYIDDGVYDGFNIVAIANPDYNDKYSFLPSLPDGPNIISGDDHWHTFEREEFQAMKL